jgi:hypothetical protein
MRDLAHVGPTHSGADPRLSLHGQKLSNAVVLIVQTAIYFSLVLNWELQTASWGNSE